MELANIIKEIIPDVTFECRPKAEDKPIRGTLKMDKAEDRLGFKPKWPLEKGYKRYCEWYVSEWGKVMVQTHEGGCDHIFAYGFFRLPVKL